MRPHLLCLLLVAISARADDPGCLPPPSGLVGWWPGDGNAKDIAGPDHGALQGGATASGAGLCGAAFNFDGTNGYVQIPDSLALRPANLTIAAWVRFSSLDSAGSGGSPAGDQYIVFKQNSRSGDFEGYDLGKRRSASGDVFAFLVSSASGQAVEIRSTTLITTNVWYHLAAVRGSNFTQLYVNGQLEAEVNVSFPQDYGTLPLYFGSSGQAYWDHKLKGSLDEVSLYNRALSANEIAADYAAGSAGKCKAPKILAQPHGGKRYWGGSIDFAPVTAGALPTGYQWLKDGQPVTGPAVSSLVMTNLQLTNAGSYVLVITNAFGSATSDVAVLNVTLADLDIALAASPTQSLAQLTIGGLVGQSYTIQYSTDAGQSGSWTNLTDLILTAPTNVWLDPQPATGPQRYYRLAPGPTPASRPVPWENSDIGAVWSDNFNRDALGSNWIIQGGANASIVGNELLLDQSNLSYSRQIYYDPWLTSSDAWTIRWSQRFGVLNSTSLGAGVGLKNFQAQGGDDRGYNGLLSGAGPNLGKMLIERFDGSQQILAATGPAISLAAGDVVDCSLTRLGWTVSATASNRANGQVSATSIVFSDAAGLIAPTISRICIYPVQGTVYLDDVSFTINRRKPVRFVVLGASTSDGYDASSYAKTYVSIIQSNFTQAVCNDSSSWNSTINAVSLLPEVLAQHPGTAILMIGGNDLLYGYPAAQWQTQYSNLAAQLQANGVAVKHCLPPPRTTLDLRPLKNWISATYAPGDIIDTWTPMVQGAYSLNPAYDGGDGTHPNDAGHLMLGQIIRASLQ